MGEPFYKVGVDELDGGVVRGDGGGRGVPFPFFLVLEGVEEGGCDDRGFVEGGFVIEVVDH